MISTQNLPTHNSYNRDENKYKFVVAHIFSANKRYLWFEVKSFVYREQNDLSYLVRTVYFQVHTDRRKFLVAKKH